MNALFQKKKKKVKSCLDDEPGCGETGNADQRQCGQQEGADPDSRHNFGGRRQPQTSVQMNGVSDGVPPLAGDNDQRENG